VQSLTLVPRPLYPYEVWQAVTSPPTLEVVPRWGHTGVFWLSNHQFMKRFWDRYGEIWEEAHGESLASHEKRVAVLAVRVDDTREKAIEASRDGHDEFWKFLGPYGWSRGYMGPDGAPAPAGLIPTLEESLTNKTWIVGTAEDVAEGLAHYRDLLGCQDVLIFPQFAGEPLSWAEDQLHRFWDEVVPLL
jgi:alkanesulfonate monooxygenase SsuD/methylene tetrahydromethanopterin reductase-like flavin-dependent oxidoreductase (luciferase family)